MKRSKVEKKAKTILKDLECNASLPIEIPDTVHQVSILVTDDAEIKQLNSFYRKKNKATDVLSFSQLEGKKKGMSPIALGDIVISMERAAVQAKRYRVTKSKEFLRLLIHGILHLFGFDHVNVSKSEARKMKELESALMKKHGGNFKLA
ncbi:MAG: rRNA maturation RNase YbeY [Deltaproteobacteria bacterium]|nr:rRNA maturation RNase YbeY [Deltaproteobacteria bacterium]